MAAGGRSLTQCVTGSKDFESLSDTLDAAGLSSVEDSASTQVSYLELDEPVIYGALTVLGMNGSLPGGDKGRIKSRFELQKRDDANGMKPSGKHQIRIEHSPSEPAADQGEDEPGFSFSLERKAFFKSYESCSDVDMFQIGRSGYGHNDFRILGVKPGDAIPLFEKKKKQIDESTVSKFACRILCERKPPHTARIYAAGFNESRKIALGDLAPKWSDDNGMDGLTTNGVFIMKPKKSSNPDVEPGSWNEVSVNGKIYRLRETRKARGWNRGVRVDDEDNTLEDGTLIDLCGATLLWTSASGIELARPPYCTYEFINWINRERPKSPVKLSAVAFPENNRHKELYKKQPWVHLACGHMHTKPEDSQPGKVIRCPFCRLEGRHVPLWMGKEPAFYRDDGHPTHCFVPCGHVCSEATAKYWSRFPIPTPRGVPSCKAACPFCLTPVEKDPGFVKLTWKTLPRGGEEGTSA